MVVRSIPITYSGLQYRSKVEASWAVMFDLLRLQFDYELDGFYVNSKTERAGYLPDFFIHDFQCWVEIKSGMPTAKSTAKMRRFAKDGEYPLLLIWSSPYTHVRWDGNDTHTSARMLRKNGSAVPVQLCTCPECRVPWFTEGGNGGSVCGSDCLGHGKESYTWQDGWLQWCASEAHRMVRWRPM